MSMSHELEQRAQEAEDLGRFDEAALPWKQLVNAGEMVWGELIDALRRDGQFAAAEVAMMRAIKLQIPNLDFEFAMLLTDMRRIDDAIEAYRRSVASGEDHALLNLASLLDDSGQVMEAAQFYERAYEIDDELSYPMYARFLARRRPYKTPDRLNNVRRILTKPMSHERLLTARYHFIALLIEHRLYDEALQEAKTSVHLGDVFANYYVAELGERLQDHALTAQAYLALIRAGEKPYKSYADALMALGGSASVLYEQGTSAADENEIAALIAGADDLLDDGEPEAAIILLENAALLGAPAVRNTIGLITKHLSDSSRRSVLSSWQSKKVIKMRSSTSPS